ncbi:MAG: GAF domain-containing protein, partial [Mycobacterium leprae]
MHVEVDELRLGNEPGAVPRARHLVAALLSRWDAADLIGDAELITTELVTNGLLYAGPPVDLRLRQTGNGVRIEVADRSHAMPVRAVANAETMTGRGLALIEALGHRWGAEPTTEGKVVWCEVTRGQPEDDLDGVDIEALLSAWDDRAGREPRFTIRLGDVPTDLLLAAKTHMDNLVREFTLASTGAASGSSASVPAPFAHLIQTVVHGFAEARQAIKRQALAAAARREPRTSLSLTLPASAADAGEEYLAALDEADAYARAARLLTLESPPQHRVFRRWYVESLVHQLRRAAAGEPPGTLQTFEQRLLAELGTVAAAQRATDRAARLQAVTASLVGVTNVEDVAAAVVSEGVAALGASGGSLLIARDDDHFAVPGAVGYGGALVQQLRAERRDADLPAAVAMRTRNPVWLESRQARDERFPELIGFEPRTISMCAVPLQVGDRVLGALRFSFETPRLFDDDERRFALALAAQTAQALDRTQLYAAERAARVAAESLALRLARLQQVTAELTAVRDVDQVADIVVTHAADALGANPATLCLLDDDQLRIIRMRGAAPGALQRWQTFPLAATLPASEA